MSELLQITLTEVKDVGEKAVDVTVPLDTYPDVMNEGELITPIQVKGTITEQEDEAAFEGVARGKWRIECTRCLTPVDQEYASPVEMRVSIDKGPMDLTDEVRQAIVLAQPMKTLCKPDCKGFCAVCRKNRNLTDCGHKPDEPIVDPRSLIR